jgi:hypothetical protein
VVVFCPPSARPKTMPPEAPPAAPQLYAPEAG